MATQKPKAWLDKYAQNVPKTLVNTSAPSDATTVIKKLKPINARLVTQEQLDEREAQARRDRIKAANAAKPQMWKSPEGFAAATNAAGDKLRISEYPNIFDDYLNVASMFGHLGSGLGQVPLNIKEGNYEEAAKNILSPVAAGAVEAVAGPLINKGISAGKKAVKSAIDRNFTEVGKQLAQIEKEGVAKGLSPHEIKMQQMEQVGITSAQREAYFPGISDLAHKYVTPYGYDGIFNNKFIDTWKNIKAGGVDHKAISPSRNDSFRLYLGMPQTSKTFEMAQTAPIQHIAYTPKQLKDLEIFSIKNDKDIVFPSVNADGTPRPFQYHHWYKGTDYLDNETVVNSGHEIMGGHNQRLTKAGLEYNDVWDLEPPITPYKYLPKFLQKAFDESPLFFENVRGVATPKRFKIPVDKFLGKPFMVHGVNPEITSTHLVDKMKNAAIREIAVGAPQTYEKYLGYLQKEAPRLTNEELSSDFKFAIEQYNKQLNDAREKLKSLEGYPKFKEGGWLDKYDDGGEVQENYNDYSVTVPPNYKGEGYFNEGRDYSPAWGGQFKNGGDLSFISNPKLRNMLEGYKPGFLETVGDYRLPEGYMAGSINPSTEVSTSIGGEDGEPAYLIPSFKYGQPLQDPVQEFDMTGQYLGGPFKTWQDAEKFQEIRHQYVEKGQPLPSPIATSNMAMGGSIGGATQGIPGATGFMYARTGSTPSKGKYAKKNIKTVASAQNGKQIGPDGIPVNNKIKKGDYSIKPTYADNKQNISRLESDLQDYLNIENATNSAQNYIFQNNRANDWGLHNGPLDAVRHAASSAQTSSQLANMFPVMKYNPGVMLASVLGTNALGFAHELNSSNPLEEMGSDLYNNLVGSVIGVLPGDNTKRNERINSALNSNTLSNMKGKNSGDKPFDPRVKTTIDDSKNKSKNFIKGVGPLSNERLKELDSMFNVFKLENGGEMKYYQEGLDFKPKSISKNGKKVIKDPKGQWAHPGEITEIPSNQITMQGVPYPVLGISDTGDMQMMYPDEEYEYDGESVTEYPMMKQGGQLTKLDQLTNFTNYNTKQPGGWLDKYQ